MSVTVNIYIGSKLSGLTLDSGSINPNGYYEVMYSSEFGTGLQEYRYDSIDQEYDAYEDPLPVSAADSFANKAEFDEYISNLGVPDHTATMEANMGAPIYTGAEISNLISGTFSESHYALFEEYDPVDNSYKGLSAQAVETTDPVPLGNH